MTAPSKRVPQKDQRAERLAAALRENLKRRKAQARAKGDASEPVDNARAVGATTGETTGQTNGETGG